MKNTDTKATPARRTKKAPKARTSNDQQYEFDVRQDNEVIAHGRLDNPFIHVTIRAVPFRESWQKDGLRQAIRDLWRMVFVGAKINVRVYGTPAAYRVVFGGDYTPEPDGPLSVVTGEATDDKAAPTLIP